MQARTMAERLTAELGTTVHIKSIGEALGSRVTGRTEITESSDDIKAKLIESNSTLAEFVKAKETPARPARTAKKSVKKAAPKKAAAKTNQKKSGSALVWVPPGKRPKSLSDQDALDWCHAAIVAYAALRKGPPFRPEYQPAGMRVKYLDPLAELLEPNELNAKGEGVNYIFISLEELEMYKAHPDQHFRARSNELLAKFERKLGGLWLANGFCRSCHQEMATGFRKEVKDILSGKLQLPDQIPTRSKKIFRYPENHPWCESIRRELVKLEVDLQGKEGDDPEAVAFRTAYLVELVKRVTLLHSEDGVDPDAIMKALQKNLMVLKEATSVA